MNRDISIETQAPEMKPNTLEGLDSEGEFAIAAIERRNGNGVEYVVSEARMGRDRKFGYAIVRGLKSEYSFDMTDDAIEYVLPSVGSTVDLAKDALDTAIFYDTNQR